MKKTKSIRLEPKNSENIIIHSPMKWQKLYFNVDEIVLQCGKLKLKLPEFIDLTDVDELIFDFGEKKHVYVKRK